MATIPERHVEVNDEAGTARAARALSRLARSGDVITLSGPLGAGKTSFARGFISALGGGEEIPSPTFTLVQVYDGVSGTIYHFDLYRLERPEDAFEIGIEEAFADGISLIEWPDRLGRYLPADRLDVSIRPGTGETQRTIDFVSGPSWGERLAGADFDE